MYFVYFRKLLLITLFLTPILFVDVSVKPLSEIITFYLLIIQSVLLIFIPKEDGATVFKTYFVFSYIFFGVAPLLEYVNGIRYWGGAEIFGETYSKVNVLLFLANSIYFIVYKTVKVKFRKFIITEQNGVKLSYFNVFVIMLLCLVSFFVVYKMNNGSLLSMLFRGGEFKETIEVERWVGSILGTVFRFLPVLLFIMVVRDKKVSLSAKLLILFTCLFCASPAGMARFMVALVYLPLVLYMFPSLRKGDNLPILLMGSIVLVFPFLENFRNYRGLEHISYIPKYDFFFSGHFDTYQSLARVIQIDFVTFGEQLLGALFFFIPRSVWVTKPIGSGALVANIENYDFSNVSMNFYGEGYINFGYLGVVLFSVILAVLSCYLDSKYSIINKKNDATATVILPYLIYISLVFTLMRGDLNVATSLFVSIMVSYSIASNSRRLMLSFKGL